MKTITKFSNLLLIALLLIPSLLVAQNSSGGGEANPNLKTNIKSLKKFQDNRFGMFIHWGPVALRGTEISWSRGVQVPKEDYDALYKEFNPVLFDATKWVNAAKDAGMKYIVLTARHHDGFCLWDSEYTDYDMGNTLYGKGILKPLAEACKKEGIDFGIYYTICDWHHEDYPVKYPDKEYEYHIEKDITNPAVKAKMDRYIVYMKNQLKELIDNYNPTLFWFDGEWEWAWTHEMGMDLYAYLRGLDDELLINNRVDKGREGMAGITKSYKYAGDYATPEQEIGKFDIENAWESCITIANQWAWKPNDKLKTTQQCIQTLVQTVGGDGNLLLNVGPMHDGRIEQRQIDRLKEIGDWLKVNGDAIYGTRGGPYLPTVNYVSTHKNNTIFIHLLKKPEDQLKLKLPKGYKVKKAYFLDDNVALDYSVKKRVLNILLPENLPNAHVSVIALEMNKPLVDLATIEN
ncbi:alpha-L-fucosidase [Aureibaculum sp. 2210JD6-5]|uniref:alpha-L-fucosidase n=1 Tax=Aureibaculum sp. 2210JD6-5 TaxID=3103957 RepID=UPI002AAC64B8|nr:alpha-L-fucosidase [Aureibaculum sp. 2210JD6-5]MDY7394513.1 alpha-L-fucosidase [Aureibaculum sp. 2210JD6-5]